MKKIEKLLSLFYKKYISLYYYWGILKLKDKIDEILRYNNKALGLDPASQEEQAMPGYSKYRKTNYYKYMIGRYLYALKYLKNKDVLEAASGLGWGSYLISDYVKSLLSIDINQAALDFSEKTWKSDKLNFKNCSVLEISKLGQKFEVILSFELVEHLSYEDGKKFIEEVSKNLVDGGILIMSSSFPKDENRARNLEKKNIYHLHIYTKNEIKNLLISNNFSRVKFLGNLILVARK